MQVCWNSKQAASAAGDVTPSPPTQSAPLQEARLIPTALGVNDDKARMYFDEFVSLMQAPWTTASAAASVAGLWEVTLPQLAHSKETLRHAAIAIGAMSIWNRQSRLDGARRRAPSVPTRWATGAIREAASADTGTHYLEGVGYYCQSLKLQSHSESIQDAVILSVLLLTFETLRADRQAALHHLNHGLALLLTIATGREGSRLVDALAPNPRPILESVAGVFTHLVPSARFILHGRLGQCRPLPNFADALKTQKQTLHSFTELVSRLPRCSDAVENVPTAFSSLDQFEEHWVAARRRQRTMEATLVETVQASGVLDTVADIMSENFWVDLMQGPKISELVEETRRLIEALGPAFEPLFNRIIMSNEYLGTYVFGNPQEYLDIESLQSKAPLFRDYLSLADLALRAVNRVDAEAPAHQLSFHCDLSWNLFVISIFCRDPLVREEALCKLRDYPGIDGLWDARTLFSLARRNRDVELANSVEGTALEQWRRLWRREYAIEDGGSRVLLRYLEKDASTGMWELVEESAEIPTDSDDVHWERQPLTNDGKLLMGDLVTF
ncbi:hypothetical protein KVR01_001094 [Diaporthe batatas]|uniref:uncharacterized protein n=1 Tax=Diaporthe batatas TaxID=748121 RepID=UPI001D0557A3|nr:uncharacterized protein KVR01_001094 [Diaporthe batatas]KAG8168345.1 hypothetical protein KVR01_001094 [Diaporthe batatas]